MESAMDVKIVDFSTSLLDNVSIHAPLIWLKQTIDASALREPSMTTTIWCVEPAPRSLLNVLSAKRTKSCPTSEEFARNAKWARRSLMECALTRSKDARDMTRTQTTRLVCIVIKAGS